MWCQYVGRVLSWSLVTAVVLVGLNAGFCRAEPLPDGRYLYVGLPGVRDYLEYGGQGVAVFSIDGGHQFVKRIPMGGLNDEGKPLNVKGICASPQTGLLHVSTLNSLIAIDLLADQQRWERHYPGGCDRMAIAPDGQTIYVPSLEKDHWHVVEATTGNVLARIEPRSGAHNTIYSRDGRHVYLAGLKSPLLGVAETAGHTVERQVGPLSNSIRPFTVNGPQTLLFANVNELLGFEVADLQSGKMLHRVQVAGVQPGPVKRHGCPSHGIALTPDNAQIWVCDAANQSLHVFDVRQLPPQQIGSIRLSDEPGWVLISLDGKLAYPSTGQIIDTATQQVIGQLKDETGARVQSEKMVEIHWQGGRPVVAGDQFGLGR